MKLDAALPPVSLKDLPALAKAAEEMGFAALWTQETQHDPFLPCALIAEHTTRLQFGTAIAVSFARSPATLAYTAWDLAAQSDGRFILGLGTQVKAHIERRFGMPWPESAVAKLREQIQAIRAFWDSWQNGTKLNFRGEYYKLTLMSPFFDPGKLPSPSGRGAGGEGEGRIPIYIAGVNTGLATLAGEMCEGFHVHPFHTRRYLQDVILPSIERGAKKANGAKPMTIIAVTAFVTTNSAEQDFARQQVAFYASTPSYRPVMDIHGWGETARQLSAHAAHGEWTAMPALINDEMLREFCAVASEDDVPATLQKRYDGLADRLASYNSFVPGERDDYWKRLITSMQ
jgi:probable F420-dependent oxidoreductase